MNLRTPVATKIVGGVSLLLVAALGWVLLVGPAWAAIGEADEARTNAADATVLLTGQLGDLRAQAADLSRTTGSAEELAAIFPATADQPGFFADVTEAAESAGIDASAIEALSPSVPTLVADPAAAAAGAVDPAATPTDPATATDPAAAPDPAAPVDPSALAVQTVSMSVSAPYDRLQELLANLETMPRALLVNGITVTSGEEGDLTMTLEGATFVAPPLLEPRTATPGDPGDPAGTAAPAGDTAGAAGSGRG